MSQQVNVEKNQNKKYMGLCVIGNQTGSLTVSWPLKSDCGDDPTMTVLPETYYWLIRDQRGPWSSSWAEAFTTARTKALATVTEWVPTTVTSWNPYHRHSLRPSPPSRAEVLTIITNWGLYHHHCLRLSPQSWADALTTVMSWGPYYSHGLMPWPHRHGREITTDQINVYNYA